MCVAVLEPSVMSLRSCVESRDKAEPNTGCLLPIGPGTCQPLSRSQSKLRTSEGQDFLWLDSPGEGGGAGRVAKKVSDKT